MALVNLESLYDLVGKFGSEGGGPVGNMENQKGPAFKITGPDTTRGYYPFNIPSNSSLHGGPNEDQAGRSLVGPSYQYSYGNSTATVRPALLDLDGEIPFATHPNITINPLGNQQLPYKLFGPPGGHY